ncbi:MAG: hypothetical protein JSU86_19855 [Phycisphaerales bacterium]|nr:MAG: hypothetical protein JSU86_19855 [Phycisphaerales bacterium]
MRFFKRQILFLLPVCTALCTPLLAGVDVIHMNLDEMSQRADKIFRGTVLDITEGTVTAGGGEIPMVTYRLRVDEPFKGDFVTVKDDLQIVDIQMVGRLKKAPPTDDGVQAFPVLPELPRLKVRKEYLLLTTTPSATGLSTTVGLGQGCFKVFSRNKEELAVNEFDNTGLFKDMDVTGFPSQGPVSYVQLAELIQDLLAGDGE